MTTRRDWRRAFWPGPLTLVAPAAPNCRVSLLARAGLDSLALRAPDHPIARALIEAAGVPLVAPSANRSGRVSPTRAEHVAADLEGRIDWILDAGPSPLGLESTIVACLGGTPFACCAPARSPERRIEAELGSALPSESMMEAGRADRARTADVALRAARHASPRGERSDERGSGARFSAASFLRSSPRRGSISRLPAISTRRRPTCLRYLRALDATGAPQSPSRRFLSAVWAPQSTTVFAAPRRRARPALDAERTRPIAAASRKPLSFLHIRLATLQP